MKERISKKLLRQLEHHTPDFCKRWQLQTLMDLAARSFGMPKEKLEKGSPQAALRQYADFTCRCMRAGAGEEERLYREAYLLGRRIRRITGLTDNGDVKRLIILLYRNIGIRMSIEGKIGTEHTGELTVSGCYFSSFYSPQECRLMSSVDSGIVSGICGGGKLQFSRRLTEGCDACLAHLAEEDQPLRERMHGGEENE